MLVLLAICAIGGIMAWWSLAPQSGASSYLKIPRERSSLVIDPLPVTDEEYRQRRNNHMGLMASPLVLDAAIHQQDIAELDLIRRHQDPVAWLIDTLQISFPGDGEILEVTLPAGKSDADAAIKVVDAVTRSYFDKVLLQESAASE
jgi:hypothetical protein